MVFASIREHAEHCDFFASTSRNKNFALRACKHVTAKIWGALANEHSFKSSKGKIFRAVKNFDGPFITPRSRIFRTFFVKFTARLPLVGFTNI